MRRYLLCLCVLLGCGPKIAIEILEETVIVVYNSDLPPPPHGVYDLPIDAARNEYCIIDLQGEYLVFEIKKNRGDNGEDCKIALGTKGVVSYFWSQDGRLQIVSAILETNDGQRTTR
jgi:hypothetical protein